MQDSRSRFTATTENYRRFRPDYPDALFDWIRALGPGRQVADLGSGTGIATRQLVAHGFEVIGVEPNDAMRAAAEADGGHFVRGEATATTLPDHAVDLVTAAQAFHWFPVPETLAEIRRIVRPGGHAVAFWNLRDLGHPFVAGYTALLRRFSTEVGKVPRAEPTVAAIRAAEPTAFTHTLRHTQRLDRRGVRGRAWSSSYVAHGVADAAGFDAALDTLFDAHADAGFVEMAYRVEVVAWRP